MNLAIKKSTATDLWPILEREEAPYKTQQWAARSAVSVWSRSFVATMNFSGKYQLQSQENFEPFMKAIGECWTGREPGPAGGGSRV